MSKAKERALAAYPPEYGDEDFDKVWDSNKQYREPYQEGYEQAEKDLADIAVFSSGIDGFYYGRGYQQGKKDSEKDLTLTWGDIQIIDHFILQLVDEERKGKDWGDGEKFYTEVLNRFNKSKED